MAPQFTAAGVPVEVMGRRRWQHLGSVPKLARWFQDRGVRTVLAETHHAAIFVGPPAARLAGAGFALTNQMTEGRRIGIRSLPPGAADMLALVDTLILVSEAQRRYFEREEGLGRFPWRRPRCEIIPNGVDVGPPEGPEDRSRAREALGLAPDDQAIGIVAALRPEKDHETLFRAVARLAPAHPKLTAVLLGSGAREAELRAAAEHLGIAERVRFAGYRPDVRALLPALDVACLTSVQETFPMSVLEAMAAARPVVMTAPASIPDLVVDGVTGYTVPVGDDAALAEGFARLLGDADLRGQMGARGRARAQEEFALERTVARYEDVFAGLAAARRPARWRRPSRAG